MPWIPLKKYIYWVSIWGSCYNVEEDHIVCTQLAFNTISAIKVDYCYVSTDHLATNMELYMGKNNLDNDNGNMNNTQGN